jgi:predicted GTPase
MVSGRYNPPSPEDDDPYSASAAPPMYTPSADGDAFGETAEGQSAPGSMPMLTSKDVVIAIMGVTGVGKSTFISYFSQSAKIGDTLESCTMDVGIHEAKIGDQRCFLIDTPGFDDTHRSDTDVLREIADWLNRSYQAKIQLAGIVYLHRIIDPRVGGASLKNLRMFKKLCGSKGLSCVVLATTMWSQVSPAEGERRENELKSKQEFWGEMIKQGSTVMRQDQAEVSAIKIIQYILGKRRRMVLDIQEEMASGKTLDETSAGRELEAELDRMRKQHEAEMRELRSEMIEAQRQNDRRSQEEITAIRVELQRKMDQDKEDRERMRVTVEDLKKQRDAELYEERQRNHERELQFQKEVAENAQRLRFMEIDGMHKVELTRLEYERQKAEAENAWLKEREAERKKKEDEVCSIM